jgi:AraC-like DNA-binding protein
LIRSDRSILEIGKEIGWDDQFHFSRMFKRRCGISPASYRLRARQD